jgi:hypothetical protein
LKISEGASPQSHDAQSAGTLEIIVTTTRQFTRGEFFEYIWDTSLADQNRELDLTEEKIRRLCQAYDIERGATRRTSPARS